MDRMVGITPEMAPHAPAPATADLAATAPAAADPAATQQVGTGVLEVVVEPADAVISVTGPGGYQAAFQGSHMFSNLAPGTYAVSATRQGFDTATEEVEVAEGGTASINLTLAEAEGEEAAQLRQQPVATVPMEPAVPTVPPDPALPATPAAPIAPGEPAAPGAPGAPAAPAAPGAPADPAFADPTGLNFVVAGDVAFPFASDYADVRAFGYDLDVRLAGTDVVLHEIDAVDLEPGTVYTIFVTGTTMADFPVEVIVLNDVRLVSSPPEELTDAEAEEEPEGEETMNDN